MIPSDPREDVKSFLRSDKIALIKWVEERIEEKKRPLRDKHKNDGWADHELPDVAFNAALRDLKALLRLEDKENI